MTIGIALEIGSNVFGDGLFVAAKTGQLDQELVCGSFLREELLQKSGCFIVPQMQGPLVQATIRGDFEVFNLLRGPYQGGVDGRRIAERMDHAVALLNQFRGDFALGGNGWLAEGLKDMR
jgi:hypothetical protein